MAIAWTDGDHLVAGDHVGRTEDGCWRMNGGVDRGVPRAPYSICPGPSGDLVGEITWSIGSGASTWTVVLAPITTTPPT